MTLDIEKALKHAFEDPDWLTKLGILALCTLIPIIGIPILTTGYTIAIMRNVAAGQPRPLPSWDNFSEILIDGLKLTLAILVYALPIIVLVGVPLLLLVPAGLLSGNNEEASRTLFGATFLLMCGMGCVVGLYAIALSLWCPGVMVMYSRSRDIMSAFRFGAILSFVRANLSMYLTAWLVVFAVNILVGLVLSFVSMVPVVQFLIICIGPVLAVFAGAYMTTVSGHLYGQLSQKAAGGVVAAVNPAM